MRPLYDAPIPSKRLPSHAKRRAAVFGPTVVTEWGGNGATFLGRLALKWQFHETSLEWQESATALIHAYPRQK
jgi:hypothetical protein